MAVPSLTASSDSRLLPSPNSLLPTFPSDKLLVEKGLEEKSVTGQRTVNHTLVPVCGLRRPGRNLFPELPHTIPPSRLYYGLRPIR
jgi:hypothetical protein